MTVAYRSDDRMEIEKKLSGCAVLSTLIRTMDVVVSKGGTTIPATDQDTLLR